MRGSQYQGKFAGPIRDSPEGTRLSLLDPSLAGTELPVLPITPDAESLADALIQAHAIPGNQPNDVLHIALAVTHGVQYLVSWNFRHIVNASLRPAIEGICHAAEYDPPILCTPEELLEVDDD